MEKNYIVYPSVFACSPFTGTCYIVLFLLSDHMNFLCRKYVY